MNPSNRVTDLQIRRVLGFREALKERDVTQAEVARLVGISASKVYQILKDERMRIDASRDILVSKLIQ